MTFSISLSAFVFLFKLRLTSSFSLAHSYNKRINDIRECKEAAVSHAWVAPFVKNFLKRYFVVWGQVSDVEKCLTSVASSL